MKFGIAVIFYMLLQVCYCTNYRTSRNVSNASDKQSKDDYQKREEAQKRLMETMRREINKAVEQNMAAIRNRNQAQQPKGS